MKLAKVRRIMCVLAGGHDRLLAFTHDDRWAVLECSRCGHQTPGFGAEQLGGRMQILGVALAGLGLAGMTLNVLAWRKLKRARKILDAASKLHESYIGGIEGRIIGERKDATNL